MRGIATAMQGKDRTDIMIYKVVRIIYFSVVMGLIVYAPIPFGSVLPDSIVWIECGCVVLLICSLALYSRQEFLEKPGLQINLIIPIVALFIIAVFQIIPLPASFINAVSPQTLGIKQFAHNSYLTDVITWVGQKSNLSLQGTDFFPENCLSLYPYASLYKLLFLAALGMLWVSIILAVSTKGEVRLLLAAVIISGLLQSLLYLLGYLRGKPLLSRLYGYEIEEIGGTFVNRDHYSAYLSMILPVLAAWLFYYTQQVMKSHRRTSIARAVSMVQHKRGAISFMTIMLILMAVGQLLSLSRAGIGSCLLSVGILMYLFSRGTGRIKITTIVILSMILIASLTYWIGYEPIISKFKLIPNEWQSTLGRWTIWKDSIKIIKDYPVFGVGLSNYGAIFPHYKSFIGIKYLHAHNDYLQFGIEMGVPGLILLVLVL